MSIRTILDNVSFKLYSLIASLITSLLTYCSPAFSQGFIDIDYSPWQPFAASLSQCAMGKFVLPDPTKIVELTHRLNEVDTLGPNVKARLLKEIHEATVTYEIYGWDSQRRCMVNVIQHRFDPNSPPTSAPFGLECTFNKGDLEILSKSAEKLSKGNLPTYWVDPDTNVRGKACRSKVIEVPSVLPTPMRDTQ